MTSVPVSTLIPFSLWPHRASAASALAKVKLPHLHAWLAHSSCTQIDEDQAPDPLLAPLSSPHERAWAQAMGWAVPDGGVPWAALAAAQQGLAHAHSHWAFITLCNWQVSNGQVVLGDPAQLQIDSATDATLLQAMRGFFAEDGIALHPYQPGQWLAESALFADLPTASLDRVIGRNIDPWLVGGSTHTAPLLPAAQLLRRLQNEMQMLLYTHAVNEGRRVAINSFWVHGTGAMPKRAQEGPAPVMVIDALRASALQQDIEAWCAAWQHIDADVIAPMRVRQAQGEGQRLYLCGEHAFHVYDNTAPSLWQRLRRYVAPTSLEAVLTTPS